MGADQHARHMAIANTYYVCRKVSHRLSAPQDWLTDA